MNPVFIFLVLLGAFLVWILGSFLYVKFGSLVYRIYKEAIDEMNKGEIIDEKENIEKWKKELSEQHSLE